MHQSSNICLKSTKMTKQFILFTQPDTYILQKCIMFLSTYMSNLHTNLLLLDARRSRSIPEIKETREQLAIEDVALDTYGSFLSKASTIEVSFLISLYKRGLIVSFINRTCEIGLTFHKYKG